MGIRFSVNSDQVMRFSHIKLFLKVIASKVNRLMRVTIINNTEVTLLATEVTKSGTELKICFSGTLYNVFYLVYF